MDLENKLHNESDKIKQNEMCDKCSTHGTDKKYMQMLVGKKGENEHFGESILASECR